MWVDVSKRNHAWRKIAKKNHFSSEGNRHRFFVGALKRGYWSSTDSGTGTLKWFNDVILWAQQTSQFMKNGCIHDQESGFCFQKVCNFWPTTHFRWLPPATHPTKTIPTQPKICNQITSRKSCQFRSMFWCFPLFLGLQWLDSSTLLSLGSFFFPHIPNTIIGLYGLSSVSEL